GDGVCADGAGACTLRAAVDETNARPTQDRIEVAPRVNPGPPRAGPDEDGNASGDLDVQGSLTISGMGATISANHVDRVIDLVDGSLTIEGTTVTGGYLNWDIGGPHWSQDGTGGGIRAVGGIVRVWDSVVTGNNGACTC